MSSASDRGKRSLQAATTKTSAHTLVRVRNNQRRHRERRRQYIASLEEKLRKAETFLDDAKANIAALETQLKELHHKINTVHPRCETATEQELPEAVPQHVTISDQRLDGHSQHPLADSGSDSATTETVNVITATLAEPPQPESPEQYISFLSATSPQRTTFTNLHSGKTLNTMPTTYSRCCTQGDIQPATISDHSTLDFWANSPFDNLTVSACDTGEFESTTLCRDAYILISQQNYRELDTHTIRRWLERGFRLGKEQDGGCRVSTVLLFSLLDFITYP